MNKHSTLFPKYILLLFTLTISACQTTQQNNHLYIELGERKGLEQFLDAFIYEIGNEPKVRHFFEDTNLDRFKEKQIEHICVISGGPCEYTGDTMIDSHKGMGVTESDFNTMVDVMIRAMDRVGYSISTRNQLLARLALLRHEILESPSP